MKRVILIFLCFLPLFGFSQTKEENKQIVVLNNKITELNELLKKNKQHNLSLDKDFIDLFLKSIKGAVSIELLDKYEETFYYIVNHKDTKEISNIITNKLLDFTEELKEHIKDMPKPIKK